MIKRALFISFLTGMIFSWLLGAGVSIAADPTPGTIIGKDNIDEYAEYIPCNAFLQLLRKDKGYSVEIVEPPVIKMPDKFMEATRKHSANCKLTPDGGVSNYVAGLPFSNNELNSSKDPIRKGQQIAWNMTMRWFGDDFYHPGPRDHRLWSELNFIPASQRAAVDRYCINRYGQAINASMLVMLTNCIGRLEVEPIPSIPGREHIRQARFYKILNPRDVAGQTILSYEYLDPKRDDDLYIFIPSIRRVKRLPTSQRAATRSPTDYNWDEGFGWAGKPSLFKWKFLGETKVLAGYYLKGEKGAPVNMEWPGLNYMFMLDVYIVEMIAKDPSYANPRKLWYIDKFGFYTVYNIVYNKAGEEWRDTMSTYRQYVEINTGDKALAPEKLFWWDLLNQHCTYMYDPMGYGYRHLDPNTYSIQHMYETSRGKR